MSYYAIDRYDSASLSEQLQRQLSASPRTGTWFALIDTAFTHDSLANWTNERMWPIYCEGKLEELKSVSPCLVPLSSNSGLLLRAELTRLLRRCQGRPMLSFIHSGATPQAICESWQDVLEIETSDAQRFLLRFADTRITPVIRQVFPAEVWGRLSNGVDEWLTIDRKGKLLSLPVVGSQTDMAFDREIVRVDDERLFRILQSGEADALASVLHEHFDDVLPVDQGASVYHRLSAICDLAAKCGMESSSDLVILAIAVFLSQDRLLESEKFLAWLMARPWLSGDFADGISQFVE